MHERKHVCRSTRAHTRVGTALRLQADVPLGCGSLVNKLTGQPFNVTTRESLIQGGEVTVRNHQSLSTGCGEQAAGSRGGSCSHQPLGQGGEL